MSGKQGQTRRQAMRTGVGVAAAALAAPQAVLATVSPAAEAPASSAAARALEHGDFAISYRGMFLSIRRAEEAMHLMIQDVLARAGRPDVSGSDMMILLDASEGGVVSLLRPSIWRDKRVLRRRRELLAQGLIARPQKPRRSYELTEKGRDLVDLVNAAIVGQANLAAFMGLTTEMIEDARRGLRRTEQGWIDIVRYRLGPG